MRKHRLLIHHALPGLIAFRRLLGDDPIARASRARIHLVVRGDFRPNQRRKTMKRELDELFELAKPVSVAEKAQSVLLVMRRQPFHSPHSETNCGLQTGKKSRTGEGQTKKADAWTLMQRKLYVKAK